MGHAHGLAHADKKVLVIGLDYRSTIIEESLEDKSILSELRITKKRISQVTEKHKTPWIKQWTLDDVEIPGRKAEETAQALSRSLDSKHEWYADFKSGKYHYIIFSVGYSV